MINIHNPAAPVRMGGFEVKGTSENLKISGPLLYVASGSAGLTILQAPATFIDAGTLMPDRSMQLRWSGGAGNVTLETSTDLQTWDALITKPASLNMSTHTHATGGLTPSVRYYRLVER